MRFRNDPSILNSQHSLTAQGIQAAHFDSFPDDDCIALKIVTSSPVRSSSILACEDKEAACTEFPIQNLYEKCADHETGLLHNLTNMWMRGGLGDIENTDEITARWGWEEAMAMDEQLKTMSSPWDLH